MAFVGGVANVVRLPLQRASAAGLTVGNTVSFVVPTTERYVIENVIGRVTTSATVGNRTFMVELIDLSAAVQSRFGWGSHAASLAVVYSMVRSGLDGILQAAPVLALKVTGLPVIVPPGWTVRIRDMANIDAAADQYQFTLLGTREPV